MKSNVIVICYDRIEVWHSRKKAIEFFSQGVIECDGIEAERYANIVAYLSLGHDIATDGESMSYAECKREGRYLVTDAPDGSRDYGGKIWYPKR